MAHARGVEAGIDFLTAIGHITTETRQEFILLSDTLGLSSLVETLIEPGGTEHTVLGPFYVPGSPVRPLGASILVDEDVGERVEISGRVLGPDGPVRAELDVWAERVQPALPPGPALPEPAPLPPSPRLRGARLARHVVRGRPGDLRLRVRARSTGALHEAR